MSDQDGQVSCETHGETPATFVCEHLAANAVQRWHCDYPSTDMPWPDAWCDRCNVEYERDGGWTDENSTDVNLKILCSQCYEKRIASSVDRLTGAASTKWRNFVARCHSELHRRQDRLEEFYHLGNYDRYDWDQEKAEIVFSNEGVPKVVATIEFVGSFSTSSETWLWSWANSNLLDGVRQRIVAVRDVGEKKDFPHLTVPKWTADLQQAWDMAAIAAHVLNAEGIYRSPKENGFSFLALTDTRFAQ